MFFKENLCAISAKNASLAEQLANIYLVNAEENIEVYTAENGDYVFSYDGLVLDDMLNPKEDAMLNCKENIPSDFNSNDTIVVFGLGTGFLLDYTVKNYNSNIVFYEPNLDIFRYAAEFIDLKEIFETPSLCLVANAQEGFAAVKKLVNSTKGRLTVLYPAAYEQLVPDELNTVLSQMTEIAAENA